MNDTLNRHTRTARPRKHLVTLLAVGLGLGLLAGCAATGPSSPSARPVLYPNAALNRVGDAIALAKVPLWAVWPRRWEPW